MARTTFSAADSSYKTQEIKNAFLGLKKACGDEGMDSLLVAKSVNPWHGHGVDIPDGMSAADMCKAVFPSGKSISYSPLFALHPDVYSGISNLSEDALNSIMMKIASKDVGGALTELLTTMEDNNMIIPMPYPKIDEDGEIKSHRRRGMIRGNCGDYRAVICKGDPNHIVPALQETRPLGIVGSSHTTFTPEQMVEYLEALKIVYGADSIIPLTAGTIDNGGIAFCSVKMAGMEFKAPTTADKNVGILSLVQGMAGNIPLIESLSNTIIVCRNTCTHAANEKKAIKFRHTKNMHKRIANSLNDRVSQWVEGQNEAVKAFSEWAEQAANTRITLNKATDILAHYLFGVERWNEHKKGGKQIARDGIDKHEAYLEAYNCGPGQRQRGVDGAGNGTVWAAYNAITFTDSNLNPTTSENPYKLTFNDDVREDKLQNFIYTLA